MSLFGRVLGVVASAALLVGLAACSPGSEEGTGRAGESPRAGTAQPETTTAPERATVDEGEAKATADRGASWDYVALGDSLAAGVGAQRGYVDRYAEHIRNDTGAGIRVVNLGVSGRTSPELLHALRTDPSMRQALREAEVVTFNIGINDLGQAGSSYEDGSCGGPDNEECLRAAVEVVEGNWDAITEEILSLRSTRDATIRTAGLGYTSDVDGVFEPYLAEVNRHIAASVVDNGVPHVEVRLDEEGMGPDGVHPNDEGYRVIADHLRELGYGPLEPR